MDDKEKKDAIVLTPVKKAKINATENKVIASDDYFNIDSFAERLKHIDRFTKAIKDHLIEGSDYGTIAGTKKPTLYKSGSEKILIGLGLNDEYQLKEIDGTNEQPARAYYEAQFRCVLYKNDVKISEGYGSFNSREKSVAKLSVFDVKNRILKMAKKRAQVDATLRISGLSGDFTQDLDDTAVIEPSAPNQSEEKPNYQEPSSDVISKTEAYAFYKLLKGKDYEQNRVQMNEMLKSFNKANNFTIKNVFQLPKAIAGDFKNYVVGIVGKSTEVDIDDPLHYDPIPSAK